ncbi:helix-turn-helix domain-containing protein [Micromonospora sp. NPDC004704]
MANSASGQGDEKRPTEFGVYLMRAMNAAGIRSQRELARRATLSNSTINRLIYEDVQPDNATIEQLAEALELTYADVSAQAGFGTPPGTKAPIQFHALAVELDQMLASDSPISEEDRKYIVDMTTRLIDPYRRFMRRRRLA